MQRAVPDHNPWSGVSAEQSGELCDKFGLRAGDERKAVVVMAAPQACGVAQIVEILDSPKGTRFWILD
jgi:hypothetical protein